RSSDVCSSDLTSARRRWKPCLAIPPRRSANWAGSPRSPRARCAPRWSRPTSPRRGGWRSCGNMATTSRWHGKADMATRIFIAGHRGMVGSALVRRLSERDDVELVTRTRQELDLLRQSEVETFFANEAIDQVYLAAAKVGGIHANNTYPAQFIYENLVIECNIVHAAHMAGVQKLMLLGSSCIYPKMAAQPMREDALLTGVLEPTNEPYAVAKIAGIKLCESYNREHGRD